MTDPLISVFTPTHDLRYVAEAWESLKAQDFPDWEWIIAVNGDAPSPELDDSRVTVVHLGHVSGVGEAKRKAVERCSGRILVELDHDDLLEPTCLSEVHRAFQDHPDAGLVFSAFTQINADGTPNLQRFGQAFGWEYDELGDFLVHRIMQPTPHNVSLIWYAPNHVRAFTRTTYDLTEGYDPTLTVLDDQDLMSKLYRVGPFIKIERMLYRQRIHGGNTQLDPGVNDYIQSATWDLYERDILANVKADSARRGLRGAQCLDDAPIFPQLQPEGTYGYIRLYDELSRLHGSVSTDTVLKRCHEMLAPNGMLMIMDREHSFINQHYFRAWTASDDPMFQISRLRTFEFEGEKWVQANLIAVKDGYVREGGLLDVRRRTLVA